MKTSQRSRSRFVWMVCGALTLVVHAGNDASAAVKVRFYPMGDADAGATVGGVAMMTEDVLEPPTENADGAPVFDQIGDFVPLEALSAATAPTYASGIEGGLALLFDGVDDELRSQRFDPRDFSSFASLSQAWVNPSADGSGSDQSIWALGSDNGGAGITSDGFWQLQSVSTIPNTKSPVAVEFGEWTHVAVFRGGNSARLYINGELAISGDGFWGAVNDVVVGNDLNGTGAFAGLIDEFNIAGFSDFAFDPVADIDFDAGPEPTGVVGDVDQDGDADNDDYLIWSANVGFNNELGAGDVSSLLRGDLDGNGRINFFDFQILAEAVNAGPVNGVPEPTSATMLVIGLLALTRRARRGSR